MENNIEMIRKIIREAMATEDVESAINRSGNPYISEEAANNEEGSNEIEILDWMRFEEFGTCILEELKYEGDFDTILFKVKKGLEVEDGWTFDY
jgi:hypothetical protein